MSALISPYSLFSHPFSLSHHPTTSYITSLSLSLGLNLTWQTLAWEFRELVALLFRIGFEFAALGAKFEEGSGCSFCVEMLLIW